MLTHVVKFEGPDGSVKYVNPAHVAAVIPTADCTTLYISGGWVYVVDSREEVFRKLGWTTP